MRSVSFTVATSVQGKQRARTVTHGKGGRPLPQARSYTPKATTNAEGEVRAAFHNITPFWECVYDEPVQLTVLAYAAPPKALLTKKRLPLVIAELWQKLTKPDIDNVAKLIMDALNGVAWKDDALISDLIVRKRYSMTPHTDVLIEVLSFPEA